MIQTTPSGISGPFIGLIFFFRFLMATHLGDALPPSLLSFRNGPLQPITDSDEEGSHEIPPVSVRNLVIENLLGSIFFIFFLLLILSQESLKAPQVHSSFFGVCSDEVILTLLEANEETTRIITLRLLGSYLALPKNRETFASKSGFQLLGFCLKSHPFTVLNFN